MLLGDGQIVGLVVGVALLLSPELGARLVGGILLAWMLIAMGVLCLPS